MVLYLLSSSKEDKTLLEDGQWFSTAHLMLFVSKSA